MASQFKIITWFSAFGALLLSAPCQAATPTPIGEKEVIDAVQALNERGIGELQSQSMAQALGERALDTDCYDCNLLRDKRVFDGTSKAGGSEDAVGTQTDDAVAGQAK